MAGDLEARRVTPQAELGKYDGTVLELRRCVCGEPFEERWSAVVGSDADEAAQMPCCGALLVYKAELTLLELVEPGEPITQPPDDHPIWQTPVAQAGPIAVTLRHMRDSTREAGGKFEIHGYSDDGNPLVDATDAGGDTLGGEFADQEQEESES